MAIGIAMVVSSLVAAGVSYVNAQNAAKEMRKKAGSSEELSREWLNMSKEDRSRAWDRYNRYTRPMESSMFNYANRLMKGEVSGGYARALADVDPQFTRSATNIRDRSARMGLSKTNPGLLSSLLARNDMARRTSRLRVRSDAEAGGQNMMMNLLRGSGGQPAPTSPGYGIGASQAAGQFSNQAQQYGMAGNYMLQGGITDAANYWQNRNKTSTGGGSTGIPSSNDWYNWATN